MRVVHVTSGIDPLGGGTATALLGLATALAQHGAAVSIVTTHTAGADLRAVDQLQNAGITVHAVGPVHGPRGRHADLAPTLRRAIDEADVVHIHALWEQIQHEAARLAHARGAAYVISPHGMLDPWSLRQRRWKKQLYLALRLRRHLNRAAALHFTSTAEAQTRQRLALTPPAIVEPNGIDLAAFDTLPRTGAFRQQHHIPPDRPLLLFLSRLHYKKGLDLLLPALARLDAPDRQAPMLALAGPVEPAYRRRLDAEIAKYQLQARVIFTGMLHDETKLAALVDADLFVLPSYHENFGIAVIEALAAGTPVVISDQVSIHGPIVEAGVGEAVPTAVEPLAATLSRWLADDQRRAA
ncbi:MAG: glycosyltransferase, partial [Phycisphaeraceae bacterium]